MTINEDGTITIRSNKGNVKTIQPSEMGNYGISTQDYLASKKAYEEMSGITAQQEAASVKSGLVTPDKVSLGAQQVLTQGGYKNPLSEDQLKEETTKSNADTGLYLANQLSGSDYGKITGGSDKNLYGKVVRALSQSPNAIAGVGGSAETIASYDQLKGILDLAKRGELKGSGTISDYEMRILSSAASGLNRNLSNKAFGRKLTEVKISLSPDFELTAEGVIDKSTGNLISLEEADSIITGNNKSSGTSNELGTKPPTLQQKLQESLNPEDTSQRKFIPEVLAGATTDFARDIASTITLKGKSGQQLEESLQGSMDFAETLLEQAETEADPKIKAEKEKMAFEMMNKVSQSRGDIIKMFSDKADDPYWKRALAVGSEIGGDIALVESAYKLAKGGVKLVSKGLGTVKEALTPAGKTAVETTGQVVEKGKAGLGKVKEVLTPRGTLFGKEKIASEVAKATEETMTKVSDDLLKAGEKFASNDLGKMKAWKELSPGLKNLKTPKDLFDLLEHWSVAFKQTGGTLTSEKAQMMGELYHQALPWFEKVAPEAYKYRNIIFKQGKMIGIVKKLLLPAAVYFGAKGMGVAASAGTTALTL